MFEWILSTVKLLPGKESITVGDGIIIAVISAGIIAIIAFTVRWIYKLLCWTYKRIFRSGPEQAVGNDVKQSSLTISQPDNKGEPSCNKSIEIYVSNWEFKYYIAIQDEWGATTEKEVNSLYDAQSASYKLDMDIVNQSNCNQHIRNVKIEFEGKGNLGTRITNNYIPDDYSTRRVSAGALRYSPLKNLNLLPNQVVSVNLLGYVPVEDLLNFKGKGTIIFSWYENNTEKEVKLGSFTAS